MRTCFEVEVSAGGLEPSPRLVAALREIAELLVQEQAEETES